MDFQRQTSRRLHEEHDASFELCASLEQALAKRGRSAPTAGDAQWGALARRLQAELGGELMRHFEFEERELFPLLEDSGEGDIAALLVDEHGAIRECVDEFLPLLGQSVAGSLDGPAWQRLGALGGELVERLSGHAQKEDMALLPALDDLLDDDQDRELLAAYVAG